MKRTLLCVLVAFFLVEAAEEGSSEKGSVEWALNLAENYVRDWEPDAHLSNIIGTVNRDDILVDSESTHGWILTFTNADGDECKTWDVDYDANVKPMDFPDNEPGPEVVYTQLRIRRVMEPVLQYFDDNYTEGSYYFIFEAEKEYPVLYPGQVCALVSCHDENHRTVFSALVETETYECLAIYVW
jgi:hypothetical protein